MSVTPSPKKPVDFSQSMPSVQPPDTVQRPKAPKRRRKRARLSLWQMVTLCALCVLVVAAASADLVYSAKLSDLAKARAQAQAEYDRRVYRTTVKNRDLVTRFAAEYAVHPAYIAAIILNESSYDPNAVSSVGARGLMQLLPSTGEWIAPKIGVRNYSDDVLFDAETNIHMGAWYINYLSNKYDGDPILVACAYHAGAGNVDNWIKNYSADGKTLTLEQIPYDNSRSYARKVVNSYAIYLEHYYTD